MCDTVARRLMVNEFHEHFMLKVEQLLFSHFLRDVGVTTRQPPRLGSDDIRPFRRPLPCHAMWTCHLRCSDGAYVLAAHDIGHRITEPARQPICRALLGQQARGTKHCVPVFRGAQQVQNLPVGTRLPARYECNGPQ